ncbi:DNA polymerase epsilon subunit 2 isoform X2 [Anthonomus grandis grandis]|uniref:DNA polymerase epsilon subunit 2 isoform X2 n=1 Tax=Anthonomus grandis grandis TaxID=2921223 RepID=UPI0021658FE6|nr:DNA polymerase epsilon subunit 2 isoform X2 [Anthonomus grandis grandis]
MDPSEKTKKKLQNALKLSGFNIRREFCSYLVEKFGDSGLNLNCNEIFDETIKNISSVLENQCSSGQSIEREHIERVLEVCLHSGYDHNETVFNVINAFDFPRLSYHLDRKIYQQDHQKSKLLAEPEVNSKMFLDRYSKVLQRTRRIFAHSLLRGEKNQLTLQTVDFLLTSSEVTLDRTLILGALLQGPDGGLVLEDPTGFVKLDLTHAKYHPGFYVETCIILVNGFYEDKILHVSTMIMPTGEDYVNSRPTFGNINYFGGPSNVTLKDSKRLNKHLMDNPDGMFVFLSDVWLDHPQTFQKLEKLFDQMEQFAPPVAFVFMGNFMSESHGTEMLDVLKKEFKRLGELIARYHLLVASSKFVFVPGLNDPSTPYIVPRLELPTYITEGVKKTLPNAIFATNPCRIQYCTKEIVVFRGDILNKLLQESLFKPSKQDTPNCSYTFR